MLTLRSLRVLALCTPIAVLACDRLGGGGGPSSSASPEAPKAATASGTTAPAGTVGPARPSGPVGYPLSAVKTIADNCSSPAVIMATAPATVGSDYHWPWTRQAMLANQQFKVVDGALSGPGQVKFSVHDYSGAYALVARCVDGGTCNQLAAMYKAIVRSSSPQVFCGVVPGISGPGRSVPIFNAGGAQSSLPEKTDVIGLCARLGACMIATDQSTPGNPGLECQKRPSDFKTACATRYPCAEVMACMGK